MPIKIFLADDHAVVRSGFKALLESETDFVIIGESDDGVNTIRMVADLKPDILISDLMLHGISGIEVCRQVSRNNPKIGIILLSMYGNEAYVQGALRAGARGYVLKEASVDELVAAVREVAAGRHYLSTELSQRAIASYINHNPGEEESDPYQQLSTREREVLHLVVRDYTGTDIAKKLFISPRTVEAHRANLMRKLGMKNRTQLIKFCLQNGILPPDAGLNEASAAGDGE